MSSSRPTPDFDDELLSAYVDNELTPDERSRVEERLRTDARAQALVAELRRTSEAVKSLPRVPLGRDLSANVLAAIKHRTPAAESPTVVTLPDRSADHAAGRRRGLVYAALALAAALLLMVMRPEDAGEKGPVAASSRNRDAQVANDQPRDAASLERQESIGDAARTATSADPAPGEVASAAGRPAADSAPPASQPAQPNRAADQPTESRLGSASVASPALAPSSMSRDPGGAAGLQSVAAAGSLAADSADGAEAPSELRTIEVVVAPEASVADFQRMLAEHQITMSAEELSAEQAAAWGARRDLEPADAEQSEGANGDAAAALSDLRKLSESEAAATEAILVEASPAVIAALVASLQPQADGTFVLSSLEAKTAVAGADVGAATESSEVDEVGGETKERLANWAWRLRRGNVAADSLSDRDSAPSGGSLAGSVGTQGGVAATADGTPADARGGRGGGGFGGGGGGLGGGARGLEEAEPRVRVLFILRSAR